MFVGGLQVGITAEDAARAIAGWTAAGIAGGWWVLSSGKGGREE